MNLRSLIRISGRDHNHLNFSKTLQVNYIQLIQVNSTHIAKIEKRNGLISGWLRHSSHTLSLTPLHKTHEPSRFVHMPFVAFTYNL